MIVAVPAIIPVTIPVLDPIVAIPVRELVHAPPASPSVSVVVLPAHTAVAPVMLDPNVLTVTIVVT